MKKKTIKTKTLFFYVGLYPRERCPVREIEQKKMRPQPTIGGSSVQLNVL